MSSPISPISTVSASAPRKAKGVLEQLLATAPGPDATYSGVNDFEMAVERLLAFIDSGDLCEYHIQLLNGVYAQLVDLILQLKDGLAPLNAMAFQKLLDLQLRSVETIIAQRKMQVYDLPDGIEVPGCILGRSMTYWGDDGRALSSLSRPDWRLYTMSRGASVERRWFVTKGKPEDRNGNLLDRCADPSDLFRALRWSPTS